MVEPLLEGGLLSAVNCAEVRYKAAEAGDDPDAFVVDLRALGVQVVAFDDRHGRHAAALRAIDRRRRADQTQPEQPRGSLSLAELCCLGLAQDVGATAVTGDSYWTTTLTPYGLTVPIGDYSTPAGTAAGDS